MDANRTEGPLLKVEMKAELEELERLQGRVEAFGEEQGWPPAILFEAGLVLEEMFTNLVKYGCEKGRAHRVEVEIVSSPEEMSILMVDDGLAFDPLSAPPPDITCDCDKRRIGGLGIHFVRKTMDHVEYERRDGRNRLFMRKALRTTARQA